VSRIGCGLTSGLVVVASAFSGFYWGAPYVLQYLGISESAHGSALFPLLLVCVACTLIGLLIGLFLYPLVLRPMLSPIEYWAWMDGERKIKYPRYKSCFGMVVGIRVWAEGKERCEKLLM
jgi:hypothetical protein